MTKVRVRRTGKPRGRVPRDRSSAKEVCVTVRMPGLLHTRLLAARTTHSLSMNQIIVELLDQHVAGSSSTAPETPEVAA
jgi:predicted HicB family RNase H-like nuclease